MRRILATLLLAVLGFAAVVPLAWADPDFSRPACCRRDGKHRCSMTGSMTTGAMAMAPEQQESSSDPVVRAARATCPLFPSSGAVTAYSGAAKPPAAADFFVCLVSYPASRAQSLARYRVFFHRTHQKRGPPTVS